MALTKLSNNSLGAVTSAGLPIGTTLQVVYGNSTTEYNASNSSSYADTGMNLSITTSSTSSKLLVCFNTQYLLNGNAQGFGLRIARSINSGSYSNIFAQPENYAQYFRPSGSGTMQFRGMASLSFLDSPSTTSTVNYRLDARNHSGTNNKLNNGGRSSFWIMEIAG